MRNVQVGIVFSNRSICLRIGLTTNQDFLKTILANDDFQTGKYDTHFLLKQFIYKKEQSQQAIELAALMASAFDKAERESKRTLLQNMPNGWRNNFYQPQQETFLNLLPRFITSG